MLITKEIDLRDFDTWGQGEHTLERICDNNLIDTLDSVLTELYPDGIDETSLNDILLYDSDWCYECVGLKTYTDIQNEIDNVQFDMDALKTSFNDDTENIDIENFEEYWKEEYADEYNDLKEQLEELQYELEQC